jgi:hypothetical protein
VATVKDSKGREWLVPVSVVAIERAKETSGVNICDVARGELYDRMDTDCHLVARILLGLCRPQLTERGVSEADFFDSLQGEPIEAGRQAILRGLIDFFPRRLRDRVRAMMTLEERIEAETAKPREALLGSATNLPGSVDSNPTIEPSVN